MTTITLSRQRRWQIRQKNAGKCTQCGQMLQHYTSLCDRCAISRRIEIRKRSGSHPYKPGGQGRPPIIEENIK